MSSATRPRLSLILILLPVAFIAGIVWWLSLNPDLAVEVRKAGGVIKRPRRVSILERAAGTLFNLPTGEQTMIGLYDTDVGDAWLARNRTTLARQPNLELFLRGTRITDEGAGTLGRISSLNTIDLMGTAVSDRGLSQLAGLPNLEALTLARTGVTDDGLRHVKRFPKLILLGIDGSQASERGLEHISTLAAVTFLQIYDASDEILKGIAGWTHIEVLWIHGVGVTDRSITSLASLPNLRGLSLVDVSITDEGIAKIERAIPRIGSVHQTTTRDIEAGIREAMSVESGQRADAIR